MKGKIRKMLQSLQTMTEDGQISKVAQVLVSDYGYVAVQVKGSAGISVSYYTKEESETVLAVINKPSGVRKAVLLDKDIYKRYFCEDGDGRRCSLNLSLRHDKKNYKVIVCGGGWNDYALHQLVVGIHPACQGQGKQVDHIYHNTLINTKDGLRIVTCQENRFNEKCYTKVKEPGQEGEPWSFSVPDHLDDQNKRATLEKRGYSFKKGRIWSPLFETENSMLNGLDSFERFYMGWFRYNPLQDFSETWYVYALYKLTGELDWVEVAEFNQRYMKEKHSDIARRYLL